MAPLQDLSMRSSGTKPIEQDRTPRYAPLSALNKAAAATTIRPPRQGPRAVHTTATPPAKRSQRQPTTVDRGEREQDYSTSPLQHGSPSNSPLPLTHAALKRPSRPEQQRKHSHGLSWTSHTRDSLVDNLLLSLDHIPAAVGHLDAPHQGTDSPRTRSLTASPPGLPMSQPASYRTRGHNHSSSISSEQDRNESPGRYATNELPHARRPSGLSATRVMSGMRGSRQESLGNQSPDTTRSRGWSRHGSKSSDITTGDYASASPSRMYGREASRERDLTSHNRDRSSSRPGRTPDLILSRGRPIPSTGNPLNSTQEAGPRDNTGRHVVDQRMPKLGRKESSQSQSESQSSPKTSQDMPGHMRTEAIPFVRATSNRSLQYQATVASSTSASTPPGSVHKYSDRQTDEKRGFFKRVFGSSNSRNNLHSSETANTSQSPAVSRQGSFSNTQFPNGHAAVQRRDREQSPAPAGTRELNKKSSSFFRRRKKSTSDNNNDVPSLPPPVKTTPGADGPAPPTRSSLYKAMDPYLSGNGQGAQTGAGPKAPSHVSMRGEQLNSKKGDRVTPSTEDSDDPELFHRGYDHPPDAAVHGVSAAEGQSRRPDHATVTDRSTRNPSVTDGASPVPETNIRSKTKASPPSPPPIQTSDFSAAGERESKGRASPVSIHGRSSGDNAVSALPKNQREELLGGQARINAHEPSPIDNPDEVFETPREENSFVTAFDEPSPIELKMRANITSPDDLGLTYEQPTLSSLLYEEARALSPHMDVLRAEPDAMRNMSIATTATAMSSMSGILDGPTFEDRERALSIYNGDEEFVPRATAAQFLGDRKTVSVNTLKAYIEYFNFAGQTILGGMRMLCNRLVLKAESQQVDRILDAFAARWCECNPQHGFRLKDVVHTMCYSLLLLNTDLHMADIESKMTRAQFVKNTLPTIKRVVADAPPDAFDPADRGERTGMQWQNNSMGTIDSGEEIQARRSSVDSRRPTLTKRMSWSLGMSTKVEEITLIPNSGSNALVNERFDGKPAEWHYELESILKSFFTAVRNEALPLNKGDRPGLRRTNSLKSMAPSEMSVRSKKNSMSSRWGKSSRVRSKFYGSATLASSRTSFDDNGSIFSSAASKLSLGKTLNTMMSADSYGGQLGPDQGFPQTIGFANALSQSNAREEGIEDDNMSINPTKFLLEDDSLELAGSPWAKEGMIKHKHHLEATEKKAKERNWNECFAVIEKGYLRLFSFNSKGGKTGSLGVRKSMQRGKAPSIAPSVVGGGNWMSNAEQLGSFLLRQTIASTLPPPGYSKARPHVWALSLPTGAVHLFQVGTAEIAREFMNTANYWSARLSKEPLQGGVDNIEYGWSDALLAPQIHPALAAAAAATAQSSPDPGNGGSNSKPPSRAGGHSTQNSISLGSGMAGARASIAGSMSRGMEGGRKLAGDKAHLEDWKPPAQSMMASQLMEVDQLSGLKNYVASVEKELTGHNELRDKMPNAYSPRSSNYLKAVANWEKKSAYLLREIVKFRTYIDALNLAQEEKQRIDRERAEREAEKEERETKKRERLEAEARLTGGSTNGVDTAAAEERTPRLGSSGSGPDDEQITPQAEVTVGG